MFGGKETDIHIPTEQRVQSKCSTCIPISCLQTWNHTFLATILCSFWQIKNHLEVTEQSKVWVITDEKNHNSCLGTLKVKRNQGAETYIDKQSYTSYPIYHTVLNCKLKWLYQPLATPQKINPCFIL